MEAFDRNLEIVLEFASRVELYGNRDQTVAALHVHRMQDALAGCRRAMTLCHRDLALRGTPEAQITSAPPYRRLLQLEEMISSLADSLPAPRNEAGPGPAPETLPFWQSAEG